MSNLVAPSRDLWSYARIWPGLAKWSGWGLLILIYAPLAWLALLSFSTRPLSGIPYPLSLTNYAALVHTPGWTGPFLISLGIALLVGLITAVIACFVGRAIPRSPRAGTIVLIALLPLFIPGVSLGAALFIFLRVLLGLNLGYWSIMLGHVIWSFPFALIIVLVLTTRFDHRLLEAASDLGAGPWRRFWDIEFPLLRPAIIGAGLFGFLLSFNEVQRSIFLRGTATTMPIWNWTMASSQQSQIPIIFSLATVILAVVLPLLCLVFWFIFVRIEKGR
ncbi:ABC transporter permease subunit [Acidisoma cellulosilytica]|uniref:ABC transporter permease subunit n=1 Tax=Acidisoma cellulosilyticum TaxID=2802395 RepID=A0A963Z1U2_9PROT|nr:ABC transporter permease subunit [Acidisoma cellulosilyticum]MCB8881302.1 ABC transporter permease subunit [Acidisoma cellulosilyticum]